MNAAARSSAKPNVLFPFLLAGLVGCASAPHTQGDGTRAADTQGEVQVNGVYFPGRVWRPQIPMASAKVNAAVGFLQRHVPADGSKRLMIIRNGRVLFAGPQVGEQQEVWSATKSFVGTALGILIGQNKVTLGDKASQFVPALRGHYGDVTLRDFATMTSGYRAVGDEPRGDYLHGPSGTPLLASAQFVFSPPGSHYAYWDSAMNQFAQVLTHAAGRPLKALVQEHVGDAIGMTPGDWSWGILWQDEALVQGQRAGIAINGGAGNLGKGIKISAQALARLGWLYANNGMWAGKRVLPADFVAAATSVQVPASLPAGVAESPLRLAGVYGFNWWVNGKDAGGQSKWPGAASDTFAASGFNNNKLFVVPSQGLVVVRLGTDQNEGFKIADETWGRFLQLLGDASAP